jgi:hypothetical protein
MNIWTTICAGLATIVALCVATFLIVGEERFWRLFGEPDLGPVSFEQLERRATPNDSLACPPDYCKARADVTTRLYQLTARELRLVFAKVIASEPRVSVAETNEAALTDRIYSAASTLASLTRSWGAFSIVPTADQPLLSTRDHNSAKAISESTALGYSAGSANSQNTS